MRSFTFTLLLFMLLPSCNEPVKENSEKPKEEDTPEVIKSVVIFGNPQTGAVFETHFRTEFRENNGGENCFFHSHDSVIYRSGLRRYVNKDFEPLLQSYCTSKSNDTLYINFKAKPPVDSHDQLKFYQIDSFDIPLKTRNFRVFSYKEKTDDPRFDGMLYFSQEIGFIYSHSWFLTKRYELVSHSSIKDVELSQIMDSLKIRSGELVK